MGLLDAYQESTDTALRVMASRPFDLEPPKPKHSGWTTIPRAVAGAFVETAGNIMDVASAYGQVQAATGANANPFLPDSPEDRKQRLDAYDKLKTEGINWQPEESRPNYQMARDLRPDPLTAGAAENIVFGLTKGLTKAITAGMIAGPVAGAGAFGVSEGMTTAEDLAAQGVDPATRQRVGVVTGAMSAAGMALPVAGSTLAKTAALVAVGGPASFVAQQAATRAILENADYGKLAQQYDPLDPVGLAIATLLPAGFATWAKAGAISAALKGKPKAADTAIPKTETASVKESLTTEPVRPVATQDQVDAAMVHNLTIARDVHEATPVEAIKAAMEPVAPKPVAKNVSSVVADLEAKYPDIKLDVGEGKGPIIVSRIVLPKEQRGQGFGTDAMRALIDYADANGKQMALTPSKDFGGTVSRLKEFYKGLGFVENKGKNKDLAISETMLRNPENPKIGAGEPSATNPAPDTTSNPATASEPPKGSSLEQFAAWGKEQAVVAIEAERADMRAIAAGEPGTNAQRPVTQRTTKKEARARLAELDAMERDFATRFSTDNPILQASHDLWKRQTEADQAAAPAEAAPAPPTPTSTDPHIASTIARIESLKAQQPDMPVALREDGTPVKLSEELDAIRRQAREGTADTFGADDAPLIQVAVDCLLSMGGAAS